MKNRENNVENKNLYFLEKTDCTPPATLLAFVRNSKKRFILLIVLALYFQILEHCICKRERGDMPSKSFIGLFKNFRFQFQLSLKFFLK